MRRVSTFFAFFTFACLIGSYLFFWWNGINFTMLKNAHRNRLFRLYLKIYLHCKAYLFLFCWISNQSKLNSLDVMLIKHHVREYLISNSFSVNDYWNWLKWAHNILFTWNQQTDSVPITFQIDASHFKLIYREFSMLPVDFIQTEGNMQYNRMQFISVVSLPEFISVNWFAEWGDFQHRRFWRCCISSSCFFLYLWKQYH